MPGLLRTMSADGLSAPIGVETFCLSSASASRILLPTSRRLKAGAEERATRLALCAVAFTVIEADLEAFSPGRVAAHESTAMAGLRKANIHDQIANLTPCNKPKRSVYNRESKHRAEQGATVHDYRIPILVPGCSDLHDIK